jgi:hypothetical protein
LKGNSNDRLREQNVASRQEKKLNCNQGRRCTCRADEPWTKLDRVLSVVIWIITALLAATALSRRFV